MKKTIMRIVWEVTEATLPEDGDEWAVNIAGYFCLMFEWAERKKNRWSWAAYVETSDGDSHDDEVVGGWASSPATAQRALLKALRKHTRKQLRELEILHGRRSGVFRRRKFKRK